MEQEYSSLHHSSESLRPVPFPHARFAYLNVVAIFFAYQIAGGLLSYIVQIMRLGKVGVFFQGAGQIAFMLIPTLIMMNYSPLKRRGLLRLLGEVTTSQWILGILGVLAIQLFANGISSLQDFLVPHALYSQYMKMKESIEGIYTTLLSGSSSLDALWSLLIGAVIPAISEESLFRGLMQRSLEEVRTPTKAIGMTALLFGILHFNPIGLIPLILIGAYLGFLAYYTQSLALPIVVHFFNNALAIIGLYLIPQNASQGEELPVWQALFFTVIGLFLLLLVLQFFLKTSRVLPLKTENSPESDPIMWRPPEE